VDLMQIEISANSDIMKKQNYKKNWITRLPIKHYSVKLVDPDSLNPRMLGSVGNCNHIFIEQPKLFYTILLTPLCFIGFSDFTTAPNKIIYPQNRWISMWIKWK